MVRVGSGKVSDGGFRVELDPSIIYKAPVQSF